MRPEYRVAVVLDENFGDKLFELSRTMHVWACDSEPNRRVAELIWAETAGYSVELGVTTFQYNPKDIARDLFDVIDLVEDHHGEYAHDPPWTTLEVFGAFPNRDLIDALQGDRRATGSNDRDRLCRVQRFGRCGSTRTCSGRRCASRLNRYIRETV